MKRIQKTHVSATSAFMLLVMFMSLVLVLSGCANSQEIVSSNVNSAASEVQSNHDTSSITESETESQQGHSAISKDVFSATKAEAQTILDTLTLEQKIGQLFISRCPETEAAPLLQLRHYSRQAIFCLHVILMGKQRSK